MRPPCVILAGGRSIRMGGGDKCLVPLGSSMMIEQIVTALSRQAPAILINSNSNPALFAELELPVRADIVSGNLGPLSGIHTGMRWARDMGFSHVVSVPSDTPFLPPDLVHRLVSANRDDESLIAADDTGLHPTIGLWATRHVGLLENEILNGLRSIRDWLRYIPYRELKFEGGEYFANINTPDDLEKARLRLTRVSRLSAA